MIASLPDASVPHRIVLADPDTERIVLDLQLLAWDGGQSIFQDKRSTLTQSVSAIVVPVSAIVVKIQWFLQ